MAEVQVAAWQAAYRGILQPQLLDDMSVGAREEASRELLAAGALTLVAEDEGSITGFCALALPSRDDDASDRTAEIAGPLFDTEDLKNAVRSFIDDGPGKATFEGK